MARKAMVFFWAGTLAFVALFFVMGLSSNDAMSALYPVLGMLLFGTCAVASTLAWLILGAREITRPPADQARRPTDRAQTPS